MTGMKPSFQIGSRLSVVCVPKHVRDQLASERLVVLGLACFYSSVGGSTERPVLRQTQHPRS